MLYSLRIAVNTLYGLICCINSHTHLRYCKYIEIVCTDLLINYDRLYFSAQFSKTLNNILQVGRRGYDLLYFKISFEIVVNNTFENIGTVIFWENKQREKPF